MSVIISPKRSIAKTITWRVVGTIDTMIIAWLVSGNPMVGLKVGGVEVTTKMILYYLHERAWYHLHFKKAADKKSIKRHIAKTITWRVLGTIDTILLAWWISGDPMIGFQVGSYEVFTKMLLYYLHERAWYQIKFGIIRTENDDETND